MCLGPPGQAQQPALGKLIDLSSSSDIAGNDERDNGGVNGAEGEEQDDDGVGGLAMIPVTVKNLEQEHKYVNATLVM